MTRSMRSREVGNAGVSDNFDGVFQRLPVTPGGHVITIYLDGHRTLSRSIYARPGSTVTFTDVSNG
jgi:hypothetical protein